jgi:invasion protein IalB
VVLIKMILTAFMLLGLSEVAVPQSAKPAQGPAKAQDVPVPPVSADPQTTSASYGDWVLLCQRAQDGARRTCELGQSVQVQGQPGPIARLAIAKATTGLRALLILPTNVTLTTPAAIAQGDKDASSLRRASS